MNEDVSPKGPYDTTSASELRRDADGRLTGLSWPLVPASGTPRGGRWLVGYDGSANALRAVDRACALAAGGLEMHVDLVFVHHWLFDEAAERVLAPQGVEASRNAIERLLLAGVPSTLHVEMGDAVPSLLARAQSLGCVGFILGNRGMGAVEAAVLGSVAYKVMHTTQLPLMLVR